MKTLNKTLAFIASMSAVQGLYFKLRDQYIGEKIEKQRLRLQKLYAHSRQEYEYVIKGEHIIAHDKRTARKIYANRHPETRGKGKSKK